MKVYTLTICCLALLFLATTKAQPMDSIEWAVQKGKVAPKGYEPLKEDDISQFDFRDNEVQNAKIKCFACQICVGEIRHALKHHLQFFENNHEKVPIEELNETLEDICTDSDGVSRYGISKDERDGGFMWTAQAGVRNARGSFITRTMQQMCTIITGEYERELLKTYWNDQINDPSLMALICGETRLGVCAYRSESQIEEMRQKGEIKGGPAVPSKPDDTAAASDTDTPPTEDDGSMFGEPLKAEL